MKTLFCAALLLSAAPAFAETMTIVKRGDLEARIVVSGTVVADEVFRIKATIEGRVESVQTSTFAWRRADEALAFLSHKELAAMLDAKGTQNVAVLEDRWQKIYRPTAARCPGSCFILKSFLKEKTWVKPESIMFEAAGRLKLVGRVRPEDVPWVRDGQELAFWPVNDPKRVLKGRVTRFVRDIQGEKVVPGATFTLIMTADRYLDPGTAWEGRIIPFSKKNVLYVPTDALIRTADGIFLPVRVSTGITTQELTEITGVAEKRDILVLDDARLLGAERHKQPLEAAPSPYVEGEDGDEPARGRRSSRLDDDETYVAPVRADQPAPPRKKRKHAVVIESVDYGEDPYAEPQ